MKLFAPSLMVLGCVLAALSLFMLVPILVAINDQSAHPGAFLRAAGLCLAAAVVFAGMGYRPWRRSSGLLPRQMFLITASVWIVVPFFAALPLYLGISGLSWSDAVFEAVSGMTTTGSTVLTGLDNMSRDLLLWRSQLQWMGGIGIIGMAAAVLPFLRIGGMKLFRTESSEWSDKALLRTRGLLKQMLLVYISLSGVCALTYYAGGMSAFNAVNHAMTTLSTGGYSTSDNSFGQFESLGLHWAAIIFMLAGAIPFVVYVRSVHEQSLRPLIDRQIFALLAILAGLSLLLWLAVAEWTAPADQITLITQIVFNLTSVVTTTGYANTDYGVWGSFTVALFFFATFIGGCSGSTSGGMKIFRIQLSALLISEQVSKATHPHQVFSRKYNGRVVSDDVFTSLVAFMFVLMLSLVVVMLALAATGLDFLTAVSGAATALMNVGPGLGDTIGPAGNFQSLPVAAKWVLCGGMILGRLEFLTIIIIFSRAFWRG